ncbi:MAG: aminopeptidase [Candidatus Odinarchaeota archaeon]
MSSEFEKNLDKYADIIIKIGLNLQPGQKLLIGGPVFGFYGVSLELVPLVRKIVKKAYQIGAKLVDVMWKDEELNLIRIQYAPKESFEEYPSWRIDAGINIAKAGDAFLAIYAENPDLLINQNPERITTLQQTNFKQNKPIMDHVVKGSMNWAIVTAPVEGWTDKIFPGIPPDKRKDKFWDTIFDICRVKHKDPVTAWKQHVNNLAARSSYLNQKEYTSLKFTAPSTDLTIGLPNGHIWHSGSMTSQNGITFTANIPTEEVFTIPHKDKTEGVVKGTKPIYFTGSLIEDFKLTFAKGKIVDAVARKGEDLLHSLIETDEGASYLGEIALIPHSSPISQSGLLFYNILIDENASNHIAFGQGYKFSFKGGESLSDEEFTALGGNNSLIHIDCMFGSNEMNVDGILKDGTVEPIMRDGEWAFKV